MVVRNHFRGGTVFDVALLSLNEIGDIEVFDMEMPSTLARTCSTVLFQFHQAGIISVDDVRFQLEPLRLYKPFRPQNFRNHIVDPD